MDLFSKKLVEELGSDDGYGLDNNKLKNFADAVAKLHIADASNIVYLLKGKISLDKLTENSGLFQNFADKENKLIRALWADYDKLELPPLRRTKYMTPNISAINDIRTDGNDSTPTTVKPNNS